MEEKITENNETECTNISKKKREAISAKIDEIKKFLLSNDQNDNTKKLLKNIGEIENTIFTKKYGLVFEEHKEKIDKILEENIPVLEENEKLTINNHKNYNFLIEGDNLASLKILMSTHKNKIDCIYIDPPYNTGNNDFYYDDKMVGPEDVFSHSKWLSFMQKRLMIAKELMTDRGVMFISIDDHEYANLKLLCDEIFDENNVETLIWRKSGVGRDGKMKNTKTFRIDHEYIIVCYKKLKILNKIKERPNFQNEYKNQDDDPRGPYKAGSISRKEEASNPNHPNYYTVYSPTGVAYTRQFDVPKEEFDALNNDKLKNSSGKMVGRIYWGKNDSACPSVKIYINEEREITPYSILLDKGTTTEGTKELNDILEGEYSQMRPKPSSLIETLIQLGSKKNSTILDFFAGSGTTGQSVIQLNKKDGGKRRFILCTNNQNKICENITFNRIKKIIEKEDNNYSLKYYKINFVSKINRFYYEYIKELLNHIECLIEIENNTFLSENNKIITIMTNDELEKIIKNIPKCHYKKIYVGNDVLISREQSILLKNNNVDIIIVPNHYYNEMTIE